MNEQRKKGIFRDILFGMAGGLAGTWLMDRATTLMYKYESKDTKERESELMKEPAYTLLARRIADKAGVTLNDDQAASAGNVLHWSYGIAWGGAYGALHDRVPALTRASGMPYGAGVFLIGDEGFNTAMGISPPPREFPASVHLRGLVGHAVYAATLDLVYRRLKKAFGRQVRL